MECSCFAVLCNCALACTERCAGEENWFSDSPSMSEAYQEPWPERKRLIRTANSRAGQGFCQDSRAGRSGGVRRRKVLVRCGCGFGEFGWRCTSGFVGFF